MRASLGQPLIIENVAGANGTLGVGKVARAAGDGYILSIGSWTTHVVNGAMYTLPYNTLGDFEPVSLISNQPYLVIAKKTLPANDLKGLIAWLKANPDKAAAATFGVGSPGHILGLFFQKTTSTRFQFVPYRGGGPAMRDVVAGHVDLTLASTGDSAEQVRAGNVKAFAVTARSRSAAVPEIPTVDEAGLPELYLSVWSGLWAPARTPKDIIAKLNAAVMYALADTTARTRLADLGREIFPRDQQTPEALAALQKAEIEKWWPIVKAANIKGE
jgi:tripartite-type tricarboxylate transporter receptor subunit TctC